ncbi:MAG: hypothetical protein ACRD09_12045 [Vicinamibacterales bacterium]
MLVTLAVVASAAMTCNPAIKSTLRRPPTAAEMAQLWQEPKDLERRDLFYGVGGEKLAPEPKAAYKFRVKDTSGYSPGYEVIDANGREWSVKQGDEGQTEVVASRLYWAVGYHQPPAYFVPEWTLEGGDVAEQTSGRFRPELPQWKVAGDWSLHENPFVGTQPYRGLLVLHLITNSWDIKTAQNKVYEATAERLQPRRMYIVRDLGATFGRPRWPDGSRNNPEHYEEHPFIKSVNGARVDFPYGGRHQELFKQIRTQDVCWTSRLLSRLSEKQKRDAFRAAAYPDQTAGRFLARLDAKIAEGLKLCASR